MRNWQHPEFLSPTISLSLAVSQNAPIFLSTSRLIAMPIARDIHCEMIPSPRNVFSIRPESLLIRSSIYSASKLILASRSTQRMKNRLAIQSCLPTTGSMRPEIMFCPIHKATIKPELAHRGVMNWNGLYEDDDYPK